MNDETFERALKFTLKWEGGYSNHPADRGGETNFGVTHAVYDRYRQDRNLPLRSVKEIEATEIADIYRLGYWCAGSCDKLAALDASSAIAHFDACVNCGVKQASKFVQRAVGAPDDGLIGPKTLELIDAVKGHPDLAVRIITARVSFYEDLVRQKPSQIAFLKGWLNRVSALRSFVANGENV